MPKIALALRRIEHLPYVKTVFGNLTERGYEIDLFIDSKYFLGNLETHEILEKNGVKVSRIQKINKDSKIIYQLKRFASLLAYLADADIDQDYFIRYLRRARIRIPANKLLIWNKLKFIRSISKINLQILRKLAYAAARNSKNYRIEFNYDILFVTPGNMLDSVEDSFLLIAKINSVPSVVLTLSLDNLNSKGTIIQVPNLYLAWNELHKSLLIKRHGIPSNRIEVSGSPYFDNYSDIVYGKNYALDAEVTTYMDPGKRWIIYLGSSANVCYREDLFLNELLENSRGFLELFNVIIRPHPANSEIWKNWNRPGTLIHPKNSELLDRNPIETMKLMQSSEFCLGINTSAFLDSIACGVPIIALRNSKALFQENSLHFQHLIASGVPIIDSLSELEAAINHNYPNGDTISTIRNKILPNFGNVSESIYANLQDLCFTYKTNRDR